MLLSRAAQDAPIRSSHGNADLTSAEAAVEDEARQRISSHFLSCRRSLLASAGLLLAAPSFARAEEGIETEAVTLEDTSAGPELGSEVARDEPELSESGEAATEELVAGTPDEQAAVEPPVSAESSATATPAQGQAPDPANESEVTCTPGSNASGSAYKVQLDEINACAYEYPVTLPFSTASPSPSVPGPSWILTRAPERYSSAAPLSPDARLRIVSERLFAQRGIVVSVSVSPPSSSFLQLPPPPQGDALPPLGSNTWTTINVARSVLSDRTSPRMTNSQRLQETVVGNTSSKDACGIRYYYYEFLQARSPSSVTGPGMKELFRHSYAATAEREGYLYTITASCLDPDWALLAPQLRTCVNSFRLLPTTPSYVPPWKDPWRFW